MIHYLTPGTGFSMRDHLGGSGKGLADRIRIVDYDHVAGQTHLDPGTWVLTALDQLSVGMRGFVTALHSQLDGHAGVRFLNHPTRTMRRFDLLAAMSRTGRNDFRAVRASDDITSLRYPVFLRSEWDHGGNISPLLQSPADVRAAILRAISRGHLLRDLLVVEFCSTADAHGQYRKYGAFIVGDRIIPRHMSLTPNWMVKHAGTVFTRESLLEEQAYVFGNPHHDQLREIFTLAAVDYGRIDYAVKDGRIQVWEINLAPTIGRGDGRSTSHLPEDLKQLKAESRGFFFRAFNDAWSAIDHSVTSIAPIPIQIDAATRQGALVKEKRQSLAGRVRDTLQPLEALIKPFAVRFLPVLARLMRLSGSSHSNPSAASRHAPATSDERRLVNGENAPV